MLSLTAGPAWAKTCPKLYKQCQDVLSKTSNEEAKKLCEEGIKLYEEGKHDESVATLTWIRRGRHLSQMLP